jgi:hypothetical protein
MFSRRLKIGSVLLGTVAILASSGCAHSKGRAGSRAAHTSTQSGARLAGSNALSYPTEMPAGARPGECFAQAYLPPVYDTVNQRVLVRPPAEKIEIIPAEYEWVEERIMVREATFRLVEIPGQYEVEEQVVETSPPIHSWVKADDTWCDGGGRNAPFEDVFCLVSEPATTTSVQTQRLASAPQVKKVAVPAEYQTIRKQKLVRAESSRTVTVPAEYRDVAATVMVAPGRMEWQKVDCEARALASQKQLRRVNQYNR